MVALTYMPFFSLLILYEQAIKSSVLIYKSMHNLLHVCSYLIIKSKDQTEMKKCLDWISNTNSNEIISLPWEKEDKYLKQ